MSPRLFLAYMFAFYGAVGAVLWFLLLRQRGWSKRARVKRRMLVDEDGQHIWRTVRGRMLVGWCENDGTVDSGIWGKAEGRLDLHSHEWAVIQTNDKLVVYRFRRQGRHEPCVGSILVYHSWREFEAAVPENIFEEALVQAGVKKPNKYREAPLKLS